MARQIPVVIETNSHHIEGTLAVADDGYASRVSDVLNSERDFLVLTDVQVRSTLHPLSTPKTFPVLAVARRQIVISSWPVGQDPAAMSESARSRP